MKTDLLSLINRLILFGYAALPLLMTPASLATESTAGNDELFARLDVNKNGNISAHEVPKDQTRLFERLLRKGDRDGDRSLTRDEFFAALVPTRPEKTIEAKQPNTYPQADAVRYLLLTMDTNRSSSIEKSEIPEDMDSVFTTMAERFDANDNGRLEAYELSRGFPALGQLAVRYVGRERINVAAELKKLEKSEGAAARRFDEPARPFLDNLRDPRQARTTFARLDANSDGQLELDEVPEPFQQQLERFLDRADRDRNDKLSQQEFLAGTERLSRFFERQQSAEMPAQDSVPDRDAMPAESMPAEDP